MSTEITHIFKLIMLKHWPLFIYLFIMEITTVKTGATTRTGLQHNANTHIRFTYAVWGIYLPINMVCKCISYEDNFLITFLVSN